MILALIFDAPVMLRTAIFVTAPSISAAPDTVKLLLLPANAEAKLTVPELLVNVLAPLEVIPPAAV